MKRNLVYPTVSALLAAALFGASVPFAKLLLGSVAPLALSAFLYLGCGLGLVVASAVRRLSKNEGPPEARIRRPDLPYLFGAILAGGVAAPVILLFGLRVTPASTAALLLNFEGVATALIAAIVFKEAIGRRVWWAIAAITLASIVLSLDLTGQWGFSLGAVAIVGACVLWGVDNNLTRNISAKDPFVTVAIKGLGAGLFSLILAFLVGNPLPAASTILKALLLGSFSYGLSIVLFVYGLRGLGAARTGALYSTAPFVGSVLSFLLLSESVTVGFLVALPVMVLGTILLVSERHVHVHVHEAITHEHRHAHGDMHHNHPHAEEVTSHTHPHTHEGLEHSHEHTPDIHHRHTH